MRVPWLASLLLCLVVGLGATLELEDNNGERLVSPLGRGGMQDELGEGAPAGNIRHIAAMETRRATSGDGKHPHTARCAAIDQGQTRR